MDSVTTGADYYLLANDFPSYIDAQAGAAARSLLLHSFLSAGCPSAAECYWEHTSSRDTP